MPEAGRPAGMRRLRAALLIGLALLPGLCRADPAAPFLWFIDGPHTRHYLLGSLHLLPESAKRLPEALDQAYALSEQLVLESDLATLAAPEQQLQLLSAAQAEQPLSQSLPPRLYERLRQRAAALELPLALCEPFKPWFCALTLEIFELQKHGFRPEWGLDQRYHQRAQADGKPVHALEAPEAHLALFITMPQAEAQDLLELMLDRMSMRGGAPADLLGMWQRGDADSVLALVRTLKQKSPRVYERLLARRNRQWLPRLDAVLRSDRPALIVVGAAHLYGDDGLLALLRQKGYQPRPMALQKDRAPAPVPALGTP